MTLSASYGKPFPTDLKYTPRSGSDYGMGIVGKCRLGPVRRQSGPGVMALGLPHLISRCFKNLSIEKSVYDDECIRKRHARWKYVNVQINDIRSLGGLGHFSEVAYTTVMARGNNLARPNPDGDSAPYIG